MGHRLRQRFVISTVTSVESEVDAFERSKETALVNTSRGGVIDVDVLPEDRSQERWFEDPDSVSLIPNVAWDSEDSAPELRRSRC